MSDGVMLAAPVRVQESVGRMPDGIDRLEAAPLRRGIGLSLRIRRPGTARTMRRGFGIVTPGAGLRP